MMIPVLALFALLLFPVPPSLASHRHLHRQNCSSANEGSTCAGTGHVCLNNTCVSACSTRGLRECSCESEEDNHCYLCCGSGRDRCLPAHQHAILRENGERWERESCARCRTDAKMEGLECDREQPDRLCRQGRCTKAVCLDKGEGQYCDRRAERVCVDDVCENPCARVAPHLMVCECPAEDRCQLCCYDFTQTPASRRCQNAFRKYQLRSAQQRPIWRVGLECGAGRRCNRYGVCAKHEKGPGTASNPKQYVILIGVGTFILAAFAITSVLLYKSC